MMKFKFETHAHTSEVSPCGCVPAAKLVDDYIKKGYSGTLITDHFFYDFFKDDIEGGIPWESSVNRYLTGWRAAKAAAQGRDFDVILGAEMRFADSPKDYLVFGIDEEFIFSGRDFLLMSADEFGEFAKKRKDILFFQAHPFRGDGKIVVQLQFLDGIEVYNGNFRHDSHNDLAEAFARENGLLMSAGSDFHQDMDLAQAGIRTDTRIVDSKALVAALKAQPGLIKTRLEEKEGLT